MTTPKLSAAHLAAIVGVLLTPTLAVLAGLWAAGAVAAVAAAAAAIGAAALLAAVVRPYVQDLANVAAHLRELARDDGAAPPSLARSSPAEDILGGLGQLRRAWAARAAALAATLASHETVLDSLPDPLFMLTDQRKVVRANLAARRLLGRELAGRDLAGRDLAAVLRPPALLDAADRALAGAGGQEVEFTLPVPVERDFRARIEPLKARAVDGTIAVLTLHDLTALKRMEQMRADFVANASHELRTPLAALMGFIETLLGPARDDSEARERFLVIMQEQAARMARLVEDLLSLSRIELNEHSPPQTPVDLRRIVGRIAETLELHAKKRGMTIRVDIPDALPAVLGQADELAQVFQNLIDNAIKYGREKTSIDITARLAPNDPRLPLRLATHAVAVEVRDHGDGIDKEHLPRLTERFFRVDSARSRKMGGTGLGLAIVKHVVNHHRGVLAIDSQPGDGSTFTVFLPTIAGGGED